MREVIMSFVWAFIKEGKGYVFSDGKTTDGKMDFDKTFRLENSNGKEFIGGAVGHQLISKKSVDDSYLEFYSINEIKNCINNSVATDDATLKNDIHNHFTEFEYILEEGKDNITHYLVITPWDTLLKVEINFSKNINVIPCFPCNMSIGDGDTLNSRIVFLDAAFNHTPNKDKAYKKIFKFISKYYCNPEFVGGKIFYRTLS